MNKQNYRRPTKRAVSAVFIVVMLVMLLMPVTAMGAGRTVARVGNKNYTSLQAAVNAVKKGGTVKLMKNITLKSNLEFKRSGAYTLNLNQHQITGNFWADIRISRGSITFRNGTIAAPVRIENKAKLTILSGKYKRKPTDEGNILLDCHDGGRLHIKGGSFNGVCSAMGKAKVWIDSGTFSCTHWAAEAFNINDTATATVRGGVFKGHFSNSGNTTIKNGKFMDGISNSNGGKMLIQKATVNGPVCNHHGTLTVKGGTFHYQGVKHDYNTSTDAHTTLFMLGGKTIIEGGKFTNTYSSVINLSVSVNDPQKYPQLIVKGGSIYTKCPYCKPIVSTDKIKDKVKISINWKKVFPGKTKEEVIKYF